MDELKIKSAFVRSLLSKLLAKEIKKRTGYKVEVAINEVEVSITDDKAKIHLNVDGEMSNDQFKKITRILDLDEN